MKLIALTAAGLLAAASLTPIPADAQSRHGWNRHHNGWNNGHRYDGRRNWHRGRGYVRCRWVRGRYGRHRTCYRVWR